MVSKRFTRSLIGEEFWSDNRCAELISWWGWEGYHPNLDRFETAVPWLWVPVPWSLTTSPERHPPKSFAKTLICSSWSSSSGVSSSSVVSCVPICTLICSSWSSSSVVSCVPICWALPRQRGRVQLKGVEVLTYRLLPWACRRTVARSHALHCVQSEGDRTGQNDFRSLSARFMSTCRSLPMVTCQGWRREGGRGRTPSTDFRLFISLI